MKARKGKKFENENTIPNLTCVLSSIIGESRNTVGLIPEGKVRQGDGRMGESLVGTQPFLPLLEARLSAKLPALASTRTPSSENLGVEEVGVVESSMNNYRANSLEKCEIKEERMS